MTSTSFSSFCYWIAYQSNIWTHYCLCVNRIQKTLQTHHPIQNLIKARQNIHVKTISLKNYFLMETCFSPFCKSNQRLIYKKTHLKSKMIFVCWHFYDDTPINISLNQIIIVIILRCWRQEYGSLFVPCMNHHLKI